MKTIHFKKRKTTFLKKISKNVKKRKTSGSSVCLLQKLSTGTSNWDKLSKVLENAVMSGNTKTSPVAKLHAGKKHQVSNGTSKTKPFPTERKKDMASKLFKKNTTSIVWDMGSSGDNRKNDKVYQSTITRDKSMLNMGTATVAVAKNADPRKTAFPRGRINHVRENVKPMRDLIQKSPDQLRNSNCESQPQLTKHVAMDCEMVGTGYNGNDSMIARVSIVNRHGDCLYDVYVTPKDDITDYRTHVSGIRPSDLKNGKDLFTVQKEVLAILEGRVLVGHALKNDLDVLFISHPKHMIRDSARYKPFRQLFGGRTPSLKNLTAKLLGKEIQSGEHNSVEDAQAAMQLYLMHRNEWEKSLKSRRKRMENNTNSEEQ